MKAPREMSEKMFDDVYLSLDTLKDERAPSGYADFEFLRDRPYFRFEEQLYCLDYEFAVSKLESGVLWRVRGETSTERKDAAPGVLCGGVDDLAVCASLTP